MSTIVASIEKVIRLDSIEQADKLELATVKGWKVVVKKGTVSVGDLVVFIPIDTIVNIQKPHFSFLKDERIRTMRIRGVFSQGLILPSTSLEKEIRDAMEWTESNSSNVADVIGVKKFEKEQPQQHQQHTVPSYVPFPLDVIPRTNEDNLQSSPQSVEEIINKEIYITKKLDGSSMTLLWRDERFTVCSRNIVVYDIDGDNEIVRLQHDMVTFVLLHDWRSSFRGKHLGIQGEFCGPKINANRMQLTENIFYVFNLYCLETNKLFTKTDTAHLCEHHGFQTVPILFEGTFTSVWDSVRLQQFANEVTYGKGIPGEGIVVRPDVPFWSPTLNKWYSVKVINQHYKDT